MSINKLSCKEILIVFGGVDIKKDAEFAHEIKIFYDRLDIDNIQRGFEKNKFRNLGKGFALGCCVGVVFFAGGLFGVKKYLNSRR